MPRKGYQLAVVCAIVITVVALLGLLVGFDEVEINLDALNGHLVIKAVKAKE